MPTRTGSNEGAATPMTCVRPGQELGQESSTNAGNKRNGGEESSFFLLPYVFRELT